MFDDTLEWRNIGPFRGGRVVAVAGDPINQNNFYFGACAGGVWKSTDGGNYWENISVSTTIIVVPFIMPQIRGDFIWVDLL